MSTAGPQQRSSLDDLRSTLEKMGGQFKAVMPTQAHVDRFIRVVMTAVQGNPDLLAAERTSFFAACMKCAQDGLMPDGKQAVLKIYNSKQADNTWAKVVQYEPMTDGLMQKLRNSKEVVGAPKVHCWYANDDFVYELGDNERIIHKPHLGDRGALAGAYSIVKLQSGDISREVMHIGEIDGIMQRTKSKDVQGNIFGPWKTDKPEMARKTVFKRHYKRLPRSSDLDNVINYDNEHNGVEDIIVRPAATQAQAALPAPGTAGGTAVPQRSDALNKVVQGAGEPVKAEPKAEPPRQAAEPQDTARDIL